MFGCAQQCARVSQDVQSAGQPEEAQEGQAQHRGTAGGTIPAKRDFVESIEEEGLAKAAKHGGIGPPRSNRGLLDALAPRYTFRCFLSFVFLCRAHDLAQEQSAAGRRWIKTGTTRLPAHHFFLYSSAWVICFIWRRPRRTGGQQAAAKRIFFFVYPWILFLPPSTSDTHAMAGRGWVDTLAILNS